MHKILVQDIVRTSRAMITRITREMTEETIAKTYTSLVFRGKVRAAVRLATQWGEGDVLKIDNIDAKPKDAAIDVL